MGQDPPHLDYWKVLINETPSKRKTLDVEAPPADATCCYAVIIKAQYKGTQRLSHPAFAILDPTLSWFDS